MTGAMQDAEFEALYRRHRDGLKNVAWKLTRSEEKAEDLVAEAFARAWEGFKDFRSESSFGTWIYRIVMNLIYDQKRDRSVPLEVEVVSGRHEPDLIAEGREIGVRIDQALTRLSPQERSVFLHRELDGMKHAEIARKMGIAESTAKVTYFHALKKLKEELHDLV